MPTSRNVAVAGWRSGANPSAVNTPPIAARISVVPLGCSGARPVNVLARLGARTSTTPETKVPIRMPRRSAWWITFVSILMDRGLRTESNSWRHEIPPSLPAWVSEDCDEIHNIKKRQPVILNRETESEWLKEEYDFNSIMSCSYNNQFKAELN